MTIFGSFAVTVTLIVMGTITVTVLVASKLITAHLLKKKGYRPDKAASTYQQIQTDLDQAAADLTDIRLQLDDVAPALLDMEFLKYAPDNKVPE